MTTWQRVRDLSRRLEASKEVRDADASTGSFGDYCEAIGLAWEDYEEFEDARNSDGESALDALAWVRLGKPAGLPRKRNR